MQVGSLMQCPIFCISLLSNILHNKLLGLFELKYRLETRISNHDHFSTHISKNTVSSVVSMHFYNQYYRILCHQYLHSLSNHQSKTICYLYTIYMYRYIYLYLLTYYPCVCCIQGSKRNEKGHLSLCNFFRREKQYMDKWIVIGTRLGM